MIAIGLVAFAGNIAVVLPILANPGLVIAFLSGKAAIFSLLKEQTLQVPGLTSVSNLAALFATLYYYATLMRRVRDVALVFAPLALAALLTVAASVPTGLSFNFANVIVLPLLFGLGVASAIHLVLRERAGSGLAGLFGTSTPRAVVFSALTTIGSFASIALSSHPGTSSMGILLALAITLSLLCTLVVLPALMALAARR